MSDSRPFMKGIYLSLRAVLILIMATSLAVAAEQAGTEQAVGQVTGTGDVTLNGMPMPGVTTLFPGSRIHTGARSAAAVSVAGRGQFLLGENSEASFPSRRGKYFAELLSGSGALKVEVNQAMDALVSRFLISVRPSGASAIEFSFQPDGTILAVCQAGGALVIDLDGAGAASLSPGTSLRLFPDGRIVSALGAPGEGRGAPRREPAGEASKLPLLLLLLAGGGGAAAAAVLLTRGEESPSSP